MLLTALGACDAFVSHSSCDPPRLKFDALRRWAETETATTEGTTPRLWLDRLCLDAFASTVPLEVTVPLLPIFAAGSRQMLALVGSSYPSRLWCVLEVFVFLQVNQASQQLIFEPIDGEDVEALFAAFDVNAARCSNKRDAHLLKAVIEATFGDLYEFNGVVRKLPAKSTTAHGSAGR